jgi:hypothetical protein
MTLTATQTETRAAARRALLGRGESSRAEIESRSGGPRFPRASDVIFASAVKEPRLVMLGPAWFTRAHAGRDHRLYRAFLGGLTRLGGGRDRLLAHVLVRQETHLERAHIASRGAGRSHVLTDVALPHPRPDPEEPWQDRVCQQSLLAYGRIFDFARTVGDEVAGQALPLQSALHRLEHAARQRRAN